MSSGGMEYEGTCHYKVSKCVGKNVLLGFRTCLVRDSERLAVARSSTGRYSV